MRALKGNRAKKEGKGIEGRLWRYRRRGRQQKKMIRTTLERIIRIGIIRKNNQP